MRRTSAFVWLCCVAACGKLDGPEFPEPLITAQRSDDNSVHVSSDKLKMDFAAPPHAQMPESLRLLDSSRNVLGTDGCANESLVGVAVFPAGNASADPQGQDFLQNGDIQVVADGPYIAQVLVTLSMHYTCFSAMQTLTGWFRRTGRKLEGVPR